jgi:hypothetical protein
VLGPRPYDRFGRNHCSTCSTERPFESRNPDLIGADPAYREYRPDAGSSAATAAAGVMAYDSVRLDADLPGAEQVDQLPFSV